MPRRAVSELRMAPSTRRALTVAKAHLACDLGEDLTWDEFCQLLACLLGRIPLAPEITRLQQHPATYRDRQQPAGEQGA